MNDNPCLQLVITQFCHGTGGKFFSTILQTHPLVQHWDSWMQQQKASQDFTAIAQLYAQRCFPKNHNYHVRAEPIAPYDTSLWSSTYDRGQDLDLCQLQKYYQEHPDRYLDQAIQQGLHVNLIFHKTPLPKFCQNHKSVTLFIDNKRSLEWMQKTLWSKHFIETENKIIYCPEHPVYCPEKSLPTVLYYKNQSEFDISQKSMIEKKFITENRTIQDFTDKNNFSNNTNYILPVSALFDVACFLDHLNTISKKWDWQPFDQSVVSAIHKSWIESQLNY